MSSSDPLQQALSCIAGGDFSRAKELATRALADRPRDADALRALGIAEYRLGRVKEAGALLRKALQHDASAAATHHALGVVLQDQGKLDAAVASYRRALRLRPADAQAHNDLGTALFALTRTDEAVEAFRESLRLDPYQPKVAENLGTVLRRAGRFAEARRAFTGSLLLRVLAPFRRMFGKRAVPADPAPAAASPLVQALRLAEAGRRDEAFALCGQILEGDPDDAEALHMRGVMTMERDGPEAALPLLERAVRVQGRIAEFHNSLGACLRRLGRTNEAFAAYNRALALSPDYALAMVNIAELSADVENFAQAERAARAALAADPAQRRARYPLARGLYGLGRFAEMEAVAAEATRDEPERLDAWLLLGMAQRELGRLDEAQAAFEKALQVAPDDALVHKTVGAFHMDCRRDAQRALSHYRKARDVEAAGGQASFNEALARFAIGDYSREAWDLYEARRTQGHRAAAYTKVPLPEWDGAAAPDAKILIYAEQGLGDEIMFASIVPEAAQRMGHCVLACDPRLQALFARSFPGVECVGWLRERLAAGAPELRGATLALPLASLGRFFRDGPGRFPAGPGYLRADPDKVAAYRARLAALGPAPYYGLAWQGGLWASGRGRRSMDLAQLAPALAPCDARWVSLQFDATESQVEEQRGALSIAHWTDALASVDDSAALIAALDGVLSVCSWVVHVAGGLGKPTLVLAPFAPEWRYGHRGDAMAWYPSARVLRQSAYGEWDSVIRETCAVLGGQAAWTPRRD